MSSSDKTDKTDRSGIPKSENSKCEKNLKSENRLTPEKIKSNLLDFKKQFETVESSLKNCLSDKTCVGKPEVGNKTSKKIVNNGKPLNDESSVSSESESNKDTSDPAKKRRRRSRKKKTKSKKEDEVISLGALAKCLEQLVVDDNQVKSNTGTVKSIITKPQTPPVQYSKPVSKTQIKPETSKQSAKKTHQAPSNESEINKIKSQLFALQRSLNKLQREKVQSSAKSTKVANEKPTSNSKNPQSSSHISNNQATVTSTKLPAANKPTKKKKKAKSTENENQEPSLKGTIKNPTTVSNSGCGPSPISITQSKKAKSTDNGTKNREPVFKDDSNTVFEEYMDLKMVEEGLKSKILVEGSIRLNCKNFREAYVNNPMGNEKDILIEGVVDRNRALDGDVVVIRVKPVVNSTSNQKTGQVVYIKETVHPRVAIGHLKLMPDKNHQLAAFSPRDPRIPRIRIPYTDWPPGFYHKPEQYEKTLFLVEITLWTDTRFAYGMILERIGEANDLKTETKAILLENGLDGSSFPQEMYKYFSADGTIPESEFKYREDLRKSCIFTIDPLTARDLDDAMSLKKLANGNVEIGVHISDVSYYLTEDTPLDKLVSEKATTIYLVESVYHMLPKELCMMCSLLPGDDRLAFSVFWEMTPENQIVNFRFKRTVINSCCQLAYEHVQDMLEQPKDKLDFTTYPKIFGDHTYDDIYETVHILNKFANNLRTNRFTNGALRINQPKLSFRLNPETGLPDTCAMYLQKESHGLIEEFMLLANITVATALKSAYPDIAFLRRHPKPLEHLMTSLEQQMEKIGIHLDIDSAGSLHQSILKYGGEDFLSKARMVVLNALCAKPMSRAKYFCSSTVENISDYWHYALNVPLYTHFTSPIRRYADVMVHRLLAAMLGYREKPNWAADDVQAQASICNKQKYNAKKAFEQSTELYLVKYIEINQPVNEMAVVVDIKEKSIGIIVLSMGLNLRIAKNNITPATILEDNVDNATSVLTLQWPKVDDPKSPPTMQIISIFSILNVQLKVSKNAKKIEAKILRPN